MTEIIEGELISTDLVYQPPQQDLELAPEQVISQVQTIQHVMHEVMANGVHYGVIPGTDKPSLLKPGAEKLMLTFRLRPEFRRERERDGQHLTVYSYCTLVHILTGQVFAREVAGSCSTRESRYAYRTGERICPACGSPAIIKGKEEYGGGWVCFKKKNGCGAKFSDGTAEIESQKVGRVANPDLADQENTVLKMSDKRALIAATLIATAASDIFTQDLEDTSEPPAEPKPTAPKKDKAPAMRTRIKEISVEADEKRGETKTADEITAAVKATWDTTLAKLTEAQLGILGTDLRAWFEGGCVGEFKVVPF